MSDLLVISKSKLEERIKELNVRFEDATDFAIAAGKRHAYKSILASSQSAETVIEALKEAEIQIKYLHEKFQETGSGNKVLSVLSATLSLLENPKPKEINAT